MQKLTQRERVLLGYCIKYKIEKLERELRYGNYATSYMELLPKSIQEMKDLLKKVEDVFAEQ